MKKITYRFRNIALLIGIAILAVGQTAHARLIFTTEEDATNADLYQIDADGSASDVDLVFGDTLTNRLRMNAASGDFTLSGALSLDGNELQNFIVENSAADPVACAIATEGRMYYNTTDDKISYCNGTSWVVLQAGGVGSITSSDILDGTITTDDIADGTITADDIADGTIDADALGPDSVGTSEVIDNSLTADDLGADSVGSSEIATGAVGTDEIADGSITSTDILDGTIDADALGADSVGTSEIIDGSITADDLGTNSVDADEIAANAVGTSEIDDESITSSDILNGTITADDLGTDSVGNDEIATDAVGSDEIGTGAVGTDEVANNSLTADDLATDSVDADEIATSAVGTDEIADGTVAFSDIAARAATFTLAPEFQNFTIVADGTNNTGTMESDHDATTNRNYYKWSAKNGGALQDYDIVLQWTVPENFQSWTAAPISIDYRTETALDADNDIEIVDIIGTDGNSVTNIDTGSTPAASATWVDDHGITFTGGTFTPGETMTIQIKMSAMNSNAAYLGQIKFNANVK